MARQAVYQAEFDPLFQQMALEVKKLYPNLAAKPQERAVRTAWHPLALTDKVSTREDTPTYSRGAEGSSGADGNAGFDKRREYRKNNTKTEQRFFVRFDIKLVEVGAPGSSKWKVAVEGQASEWDGTGVPSRLRGAERPYWLDKRMASLEIAVYERLKSSSAIVSQSE